MGVDVVAPQPDQRCADGDGGPLPNLQRALSALSRGTIVTVRPAAMQRSPPAAPSSARTTVPLTRGSSR